MNGRVVIGRNGIVAAVYGHGIVVSGESEWDGTIKVKDTIRVYSGGYGMGPVTEEVATTLKSDERGTLAEKVRVGSLGYGMVALSGSCSVE